MHQLPQQHASGDKGQRCLWPHAPVPLDVVAHHPAALLPPLCCHAAGHAHCCNAPGLRAHYAHAPAPPCCHLPLQNELGHLRGLAAACAPRHQHHLSCCQGAQHCALEACCWQASPGGCHAPSWGVGLAGCQGCPGGCALGEGGGQGSCTGCCCWGEAGGAVQLSCCRGGGGGRLGPAAAATAAARGSSAQGGRVAGAATTASAAHAACTAAAAAAAASRPPAAAPPAPPTASSSSWLGQRGAPGALFQALCLEPVALQGEEQGRGGAGSCTAAPVLHSPVLKVQCQVQARSCWGVLPSHPHLRQAVGVEVRQQVRGGGAGAASLPGNVHVVQGEPQARARAGAGAAATGATGRGEGVGGEEKVHVAPDAAREGQWALAGCIMQHHSHLLLPGLHLKVLAIDAQGALQLLLCQGHCIQGQRRGGGASASASATQAGKDVGVHQGTQAVPQGGHWHWHWCSAPLTAALTAAGGCGCCHG